MLLGVGFEISKGLSSRFSLLPTCGLRCELSAAVSVRYLHTCLPAAMLPYQDGDGLLPFSHWKP